MAVWFYLFPHLVQQIFLGQLFLGSRFGKILFGEVSTADDDISFGCLVGVILLRNGIRI